MKFSLNTYLTVIVLVAVFPVILFSGLMINRVVDSKRDSSEELLARTAQELALAFDQEVLSTIQTLEALSEGNDIKSGNIKAFHQIATRVLRNQKNWRNILLLDRNSRILSARYAFGVDVGPVVDRESLEEVFQTGRPTIGNIIYSPDKNNPGFAVRVPVRNLNHEVIYVLSAIYGLEPTQQLVLKYSTAPGEWVRALIDRNGILAGRSRDPEKFVGTPASETLRAAIKSVDKGIVESITHENVTAYSGIYRSLFTGYVAAVAVPK